MSNLPESDADYLEAGEITVTADDKAAAISSNKQQESIAENYERARTPPKTRDDSKSRRSKSKKVSSKSTRRRRSSSRAKNAGKSKSRKQKVEKLISDDDQTVATSKSEWTAVWTVGTMFTSNVELIDEDFDSLLHRDDRKYITKRFGCFTLATTLLQLFFLTMTISMCGIAPFYANGGIGPYPDALSNAGAINSYEIGKGRQYWRLLSAQFIPAGVLHFLLSSMVQLEVGGYLERDWGGRKWFAIYLLSGIGTAGFCSALDGREVSVAGSGALMGLIGAKLSESAKHSLFKTKRSESYDSYRQQTSLMIFVAVFVTFQCLIPYVSWAGHVGGFFTGFCTGMAILASNIKREFDRLLWSSIGITCLVFSTALMITILSGSSVPDNLADTCAFYDDIHVEGYDCACGF